MEKKEKEFCEKCFDIITTLSKEQKELANEFYDLCNKMVAKGIGFVHTSDGTIALFNTSNLEDWEFHCDPQNYDDEYECTEYMPNLYSKEVGVFVESLYSCDQGFCCNFKSKE